MFWGVSDMLWGFGLGLRGLGWVIEGFWGVFLWYFGNFVVFWVFDSGFLMFGFPGFRVPAVWFWCFGFGGGSEVLCVFEFPVGLLWNLGFGVELLGLIFGVDNFGFGFKSGFGFWIELGWVDLLVCCCDWLVLV